MVIEEKEYKTYEAPEIHVSDIDLELLIAYSSLEKPNTEEGDW